MRNIILMLSLLCCSCSERDLGEGYYFLPKYESVDIGYPNEEAIIYQSKEENQFNNIKINGDVVEVKSNSKFIIAKRDPLKSRDINTGIIEYYIILKKNDSLIGPLEKRAFHEEIKKCNINLKFQ